MATASQIHDRDSIFSHQLDQCVRHLGLRVLKTPPQSPQANALCERLLGTMRRECLDFVIPLGVNHLRRLLHAWVRHYNASRPHMALGRYSAATSTGTGVAARTPASPSRAPAGGRAADPGRLTSGLPAGSTASVTKTPELLRRVGGEEMSRATRATPRVVYQIKVTLKGSKPPIWRRMQVTSETTLVKLHRILQRVMGWGLAPISVCYRWHRVWGSGDAGRAGC